MSTVSAYVSTLATPIILYGLSVTWDREGRFFVEGGVGRPVAMMYLSKDFEMRASHVCSCRREDVAPKNRCIWMKWMNASYFIQNL